VRQSQLDVHVLLALNFNALFPPAGFRNPVAAIPTSAPLSTGFVTKTSVTTQGKQAKAIINKRLPSTVRINFQTFSAQPVLRRLHHQV
jgi:hypothetical protein